MPKNARPGGTLILSHSADGKPSGLAISYTREPVVTESPYAATLHDLSQRLDGVAHTTSQQLAALSQAMEWLECERWQHKKAFSLNHGIIDRWLEKGWQTLQGASAAASQLLALLDEHASLTQSLLQIPVISASYTDRFETLVRELETQSMTMQQLWSDSQEWLATALPSLDPELHTKAGQATLACLDTLHTMIRFCETNHTASAERLERRRPDPESEASRQSCPECGVARISGARYCPHCGSPLTTEVTSAALAPYPMGPTGDRDQEIGSHTECSETDLDLAMAALEKLKALKEATLAREKALPRPSPQPPPPSQATGTNKQPPISPDPVHFSITAPAVLAANSPPVILDVWAHLDSQRADVIARAKEERGTDTVRRGSKGPVLIERGTQIAVELCLPTLVVSESNGTILWMGEVANTSFEVRAPEGIRSGEHAGSCRFYVGGMQIAKLLFSVMVGEAPGQIVQLETKEEHVRTAFASYAHVDKAEVLARIQGMLKVRPDLDIFVDVASLRSGEKYEQRLMEEIARRDILYLFWSQAARQSKWVKKEWRAALTAHGIDAINPVPLQPPEIAPPPRELGTRLHFNDWTLFFTRGQAS